MGLCSFNEFYVRNQIIEMRNTGRAPGILSHPSSVARNASVLHEDTTHCIDSLFNILRLAPFRTLDGLKCPKRRKRGARRKGKREEVMRPCKHWQRQPGVNSNRDKVCEGRGLLLVDSVRDCGMMSQSVYYIQRKITRTSVTGGRYLVREGPSSSS